MTFTGSGGINGTYVDGVLTLTGSATAAAYQTVLQSVAFTTDAAGLVGVRTIEFSVVDAAGQESLLPGVTALTVVGVEWRPDDRDQPGRGRDRRSVDHGVAGGRDRE
ncbi:hypothetical protein H7J08_20515 [Mycobacterium frederiksbergense]|uniref:hypothetical protein n=1 Tax=Mycolicibacterium frederiksbergense TaxID=117567 RepID=UPI0021F34A38|nr:hypothetical protein [Mycolicibacterium frederiksbergense]MCV7047032.1 hypothetical protein [Mycolicibacterium frederiksbergense]